MKIKQFAEMIKECNNIVFFGGAGVSTESGIKDYGSKDGLYNTVKDFGVSPEEILSRSFFERHPDVFYSFHRQYFMVDVEPNDAHKALAELENKDKLNAIITQNIDRLHQKAGSKNVIELHGTTTEYICHKCKKSVRTVCDVEKEIVNGRVPKCEYCGGIVRPKVVLYEEMLHEGVIENAIYHVENADMIIVGGTSLVVQPAASIISYFRGKYLVIINKTETGYDDRADLIMRDSIGKVFAETMRTINEE